MNGARNGMKYIGKETKKKHRAHIFEATTDQIKRLEIRREIQKKKKQKTNYTEILRVASDDSINRFAVMIHFH